MRLPAVLQYYIAAMFRTGKDCTLLCYSGVIETIAMGAGTSLISAPVYFIEYNVHWLVGHSWVQLVQTYYFLIQNAAYHYVFDYIAVFRWNIYHIFVELMIYIRQCEVRLS